MIAGHAAVVLAAGASRRLGQPKQWLRRDGETLIRRVTRLALASAPTRVLVVCSRTAFDAVADELRELPVECLANPEAAEGMASSVRLAAGRLLGEEARSLWLGCDQPALEPSHLHELLALAQSATSGCAATAWPDGDGRWRAGVPAVVTPQVLQAVDRLHGDTGLRPLLNALPADTLGWLHAPPLWRDLDTPEDVADAVRAGYLDAVD